MFGKVNNVHETLKLHFHTDVLGLGPKKEMLPKLKAEKIYFVFRSNISF